MHKFLSDQKLSKDDREFLFKIAAGRPGYAKRLLENDSLAAAKVSISDLRKLFNQGIAERISYARKLAEKENHSQVIRYWLDWIGASLSQSDKNAPILSNLLNLNNIVSQSQFNARLAIENFLLKI
jgi:hypothetical protein